MSEIKKTFRDFLEFHAETIRLKMMDYVRWLRRPVKVVEDYLNIRHSGKLVLLMDILRECETIVDKYVVFSQSLLDLFKEFLTVETQQKKQKNGILKEHYFRFDGTTKEKMRQQFCDSFNN